ncbi:MAG: 2-iminoacetate synthase ThiH [Chitinispirillales bacterium]|nr:2-iminoacetate synthase ThiH [Chitinispirillales bacterium]
MLSFEEEINLFYSQKKINKNCEKILELLDEKNDLEYLAKESQRLTKQYFGSAIKLFTPLYISNYCTNGCVYCSFRRENKIVRKQLNERQIHEQCERIAKTGLRQILVLTGEASKFTTFEYVKNSLKIISQYFSSLNVEIYPLEIERYKILSEEIGVDGVTMYQETYNRKLYEKYHLFGKKKDYLWRLNGLARASEAGMRNVQLGALLGLDDPKTELLALALHIDWLQKNFPETDVSVSFPRIRPIENGAKYDFFEVSDKFYARIIASFRIVYPNLSITLSTRETKKMRNGLLNFGITKISAGVSTAVGESKDSGSQFEIADERSVDEICRYLTENEFQAVFHDWNFELLR